MLTVVDTQNDDVMNELGCCMDFGGNLYKNFKMKETKELY